MPVRLLVGALTIASTILMTCTARAEKRVALVVGNSSYVHVKRLANPGNDARLTADTLRSLGFTLIGGGPQLDLDKPAFDNAVQRFGVEAQGSNVALFYYAGHGLQVRGVNYLVPVGANPTREADLDFQMLNVNLVLRQLESAGTKLNLVILDACRNNPFGERGFRSADSGLAQMQAPEGTLISFATQPGHVALDGGGSHSPFTLALAETIRRPGLGIFDTFNQVGLAVKRATAGTQQPWVSSSPIDGNFYFAAAPPPPPVAPTSAPGSPASANSPPRGDVAAAYWKTRQIGTCGAYEAFVRTFGDTFEATLAQEYLRKNCGQESKAASHAPVTPSGLNAPPPSTAMRTFRVMDDVSGGFLNMRAGPGTNHEVIAAIPAGTSALRVGTCHAPDDGGDRDWCQVEWRSFAGWVSSCCIAQVFPRGQRLFRVLKDVSEGKLNVRRGPGTGHVFVVAIPAGATGVLVGRCRMPDDRGGKPWCEVEWRGHRGWASACCMVDVNTGAYARADQ